MRPYPVDNYVWHSFRGGAYTGVHPAFYDPSVFGWAQDGKEKYAALRSEVETYLEKSGRRLEPYFYGDLISRKDAWKTVVFYAWGQRQDEACAECPQLVQYLESIPGMTSAALSLLEPNTDIHPHYGDTNAVMRCHLGLHVPAPLPVCGLDVHGEHRGWQEGEWLMFCDAHRHRAWNHSDRARVVLIVDVLLPEFRAQQKDICRDVLSMHALQRLEQKRPFVRRLPGKVRGLIRRYLKTRLK